MTLVIIESNGLVAEWFIDKQERTLLANNVSRDYNNFHLADPQSLTRETTVTPVALN